MKWLLHWLQRFVISVVILALIWVAGLLSFSLRIPTQAQSSTAKVDAAIVLTGGSKRVEHGFQRVAEGLASELFISGVNDEATPQHIIETTRKAMHALPAAPLTLGYEARSTIGNAKEVQDWIALHQIRSIRLITANYHMPRSLDEFEFVLPKGIALIPDPVFPDGFDISRWLVDSNSRRLVMNEYHKFLAAHIRHFIVSTQQF